MKHNDLRQQRLEAYNAKKQAKFNKTIGKKPSRIKVKNGTINSIKNKYALSRKAAEEYNNLVRTKSAIGFRMALIKAIATAGNTHKDNIIKMFFYAKDVEAYAHWFETEIDKAEVSSDNVLGKELVNNMKVSAFNNSTSQARKIVEAFEADKAEDKISDKLKSMIDELDDLTEKLS